MFQVNPGATGLIGIKDAVILMHRVMRKGVNQPRELVNGLIEFL